MKFISSYFLENVSSFPKLTKTKQKKKTRKLFHFQLFEAISRAEQHQTRVGVGECVIVSSVSICVHINTILSDFKCRHYNGIMDIGLFKANRLKKIQCPLWD